MSRVTDQLKMSVVRDALSRMVGTSPKEADKVVKLLAEQGLEIMHKQDEQFGKEETPLQPAANYGLHGAGQRMAASSVLKQKAVAYRKMAEDYDRLADAILALYAVRGGIDPHIEDAIMNLVFDRRV